MDIKGTPIFAGLARRLETLAARTAVISHNIANADTPGYVARDLAARPAGAATRPPALKVSDPRHLAAPAGVAAAAPKTVAAPDGEASLNGNQVAIETQMLKLSETRGDYQLVSSVYRKTLGMLRLAARGPGQ